MTWFQATAFARNSGKRLPTNAEWQTAALGTPDPGATTSPDCNNGTGFTGSVALTGASSLCVSDIGAFDMVGNVAEMTADWVPFPTTRLPPMFAGDVNFMGGPTYTEAGPGVVVRGGVFHWGVEAGVYSIMGNFSPSSSVDSGIGFRAVR